MSNLSDVVKNFEKAVYDRLAAKVNNIYTNDFVLKTECQTDKTEFKKKKKFQMWMILLKKQNLLN